MATYAGRYDEVLIRRLGNRPAFPSSGTTVMVYESDGSTEASLYTDRTKATAADNPVSVDASGNLEFFANPGTYVLSIREDGVEVATNTISVPTDPDDIPSAGAISVSAATKAADETVNNSAVLQDDNDLSLSLGVGTFILEGLLVYSSSATAGISFDWGGTSTGTLDWQISGEDDADLDGAGVGTERGASFRGTATITVAGTVVLQWAQTTAETTNTVLHAGSHITAIEV